MCVWLCVRTRVCVCVCVVCHNRPATYLHSLSLLLTLHLIWISNYDTLHDTMEYYMGVRQRWEMICNVQVVYEYEDDPQHPMCCATEWSRHGTLKPGLRGSRSPLQRTVGPMITQGSPRSRDVSETRAGGAHILMSEQASRLEPTHTYSIDDIGE